MGKQGESVESNWKKNGQRSEQEIQERGTRTAPCDRVKGHSPSPEEEKGETYTLIVRWTKLLQNWKNSSTGEDAGKRTQSDLPTRDWPWEAVLKHPSHLTRQVPCDPAISPTESPQQDDPFIHRYVYVHLYLDAEIHRRVHNAKCEMACEKKRPECWTSTTSTLY